MKISTRARYGVRLMKQLALNHENGLLFLKDIAKEENISEKYLSQIIIPLKTSGLVTANRGSQGGYKLAKPPSAITIKEIVEILEGSLTLVECIHDYSACERIPFCVTRDIWKMMGEKMAEVLESVTLDDLINMSREKEILMYNI